MDDPVTCRSLDWLPVVLRATLQALSDARAAQQAAEQRAQKAGAMVATLREQLSDLVNNESCSCYTRGTGPCARCKVSYEQSHKVLSDSAVAEAHDAETRRPLLEQIATLRKLLDDHAADAHDEDVPDILLALRDTAKATADHDSHLTQPLLERIAALEAELALLRPLCAPMSATSPSTVTVKGHP